MGEVWLARDLHLDRNVALKLLPSDLTAEPTRVKRFEQEARAASALNHPNVCTIHTLGHTDGGRHFIAMEHVDGQTRLAGTRLTVPEAVEIIVQIASALAAAHAAGIVHRDIKPDNVMIRPDRLVKVLDFGLAKLTPAAFAPAADESSGRFRQPNPGGGEPSSATRWSRIGQSSFQFVTTSDPARLLLTGQPADISAMDTTQLPLASVMR